MKILSELGVPLNRLLQEFMPNLLPPNEEGYAWGDGPIWEAKADTAIAVAEATKPAEPKALPSGGKSPAKGENPARELLRALEANQTRMVEYGSDEHERLWRRFERRTERAERAWLPVMADLFRRQQESVLARLREQNGRFMSVYDLTPLVGLSEQEWDQYKDHMRDAFNAESSPFDREEWDKRFVQSVLPLLTDTLADAAADTLDELGVTSAFDVTNPMVTQWLRQRAQRFATQVNETTWEQLRESLSQGIDAGEGIDELAERVKGVMQEASDVRARVIARTESVSASNAGGLEAARTSGVVKGKSWLSTLDSRTRDTHAAAHGQTVGLEDDFRVGDASGPAPGQMGLASEDVQCRCTLLWVLK
jgi:SPP1 gp7 family putative phage head morphogenesis protein